MTNKFNEIYKLQKIAGILKEGVNEALPKQPFEKVIPIHDVHSDYFDYDVDQIQDFVNDSGFMGYDGGIVGWDGTQQVDKGKDYQWAIAMGDDFPHAIVIKNKEMLKNPEIVDVLKRFKSRTDLSS